MTEEHITGPQQVAGVEIGSRGRALLRLLSAAWREYESDYARYFVSAMVYYALISLSPLLLLLLGAIGLLMRLSVSAAAVRIQAQHAVESAFGPELWISIEHLLDGLERQSVVASLISLAALFWSASLVMRHLRLSFRAIWKVAPPLVSGSLPVVVRAALLEKAIALGTLLSGMLLAFTTVALIALANWLIASLQTRWLIAIPASFVVVPMTFAFLFTYLPPIRLPWRHVRFATLLCMSAWLIGVELLALYGAFFGRNVSVYGAIGGVLVIMLWLNVVAQGLFFGAELCKVSYWWSSPQESPLRRADHDRHRAERPG